MNKTKLCISDFCWSLYCSAYIIDVEHFMTMLHSDLVNAGDSWLLNGNEDASMSTFRSNHGYDLWFFVITVTSNRFGWVDFVAIPVSSQRDIQHCKAVVVLMITDSWKMRSELHFTKFKNKTAVWFWQWYNLPTVFNVTVDHNTESGFLWPICRQCCNDCDVN